MTLEIKRKNQFVLLIRYSPHHSINIFFILLSLAVLVVCLFEKIILSIVGFMAVAFLIFFIVIMFREREIWCAIDKEIGIVTYKKHGILNSQYNARNVQYRITGITALEIERYAHRGRDTFQIRLILGSRKLLLSSANLDFYECQSCAGLIQQFIGDLSLRVID